MKPPMMPCGAGRDIGTDMPGWDKPCDAEAQAVVAVRGVLPQDIAVALCREHRTMLDALDMIERTP